MSCDFLLLVLVEVLLLVSVVDGRLVLEGLAVLGSNLVSIVLWHHVVLLFLERSRREVEYLWLVHDGTCWIGTTHPLADPELVV